VGAILDGPHFYTAYGLGISSVLPLPELMPGASPADVAIRRGTVDRSPAEAASPRPCFRATAEEAGLHWAQVGTLLIRRGEEIVVEPIPDVDKHLFRLYILGPALALLLHQRGFLVLHASAVAVEGGAVAFLGGSGWGKSTMAAALHKRGHAIVTDDVLAVDAGSGGSPIVLPGFPRLKLWPDAAASLGDVPEMLPRLHPSWEKRSRRDSRGFPQKPLPLERVYVLAEGTHPEIEAIQPQEAFVELVRHSFVARLLQATGAATTHFYQCAELVRAVPIRRLRAPRALSALPDLARLIEEDVAGGQR
jgi:hypothetical protein